MKTTFLTEDFLLESPLAREVYHGHVEGLPVVDYHNHLDVRTLGQVAADIGVLWVASDPYKHRAMRMAGEPERVVTGGASSREKFDAWARTLPKTLGNPLFHWSCLEMKQVFGLDEVPDPSSADRIWEACNAALPTGVAVLERFRVKRLSTSDDLLDDVSLHARVPRVRVTPSLRGDSILSLRKPWLERLGAVSDLEAFLEAVRSRLDVFAAAGCRIADHALDDGWTYVPTSFDEAARLYAAGEADARLRSFLLHWLGTEYARRGWVLLLHIGALRSTSSRLRTLSGPAGGYAALGSGCDIRSLCTLLDTLEASGRLPRCILFNLNPSDNAALATLTGSFAAEDGAPKLQFGPAWWYNDHLAGIEANLETLSAYSLLPLSVGMTTDSRSVLSFSRHDYFRRILCNFLASKAVRGQLPADADLLGRVAADIACSNAEHWIDG